MVCLDTDILIHFLRKNRDATDLVEKVVKTDEKISTTVINEFELWKGFYRIKKKDRRNSLEQLLSQVNKLHLDSESSKKAAEIFESLKEKGEMLDLLDILIASIAITNNESLLTLNKKHFERIEGLKLI